MARLSRTVSALLAACVPLLTWSAVRAAEAEPPAPPAPPATPPGAAKTGRWSAGLDAAALGIPDPVAAPSAAAVEPTGEDSGGEFFVVPIPRLDPALGAGLIGAAAYIFPLDSDDTESPPSIVGGAAFWMNGGSWGGGVGSKLYMKRDRVRLLTGLAYADLSYDLFVTPERSNEERRIPLNQVISGGVVHAQFRVAKDFYLGVRALVGKITTTPEEEKLPPLPATVEEEIDGEIRLNSVGLSLALDTRDSTYYPRHGVALDLNADMYFSAIGSDVSYDRYELNYRQYAPVGQDDVLAWQGYVCVAGDEAPFFLQCQVGPRALLRGYSFGRYWGPAMAATQAEYRWQVGRRWILAAFGGVTQVAQDFGGFTLDGNLYAGGAGVRFVVEPKNGVTLRADYAWGEGERALYISVGEAF
ncbi:MAG: outer membrane protein assembly factor [Acidobacteria bacterium]|nr:outer membrane protein assembly factor [Acidobacteriota bacterium]